MSPDSTLIATVGEVYHFLLILNVFIYYYYHYYFKLNTYDESIYAKYDRLVKIWCCPKNDGKEWKYKFHYLPHPRSVTNFSWRKGPVEQIK